MDWERPAWRDAMRVDWPTGQHGDAEIRTITITEQDARFSSMRAALKGRGRVTAGDYTGLYIRGHLWMSDTTDEQRDHVEFLRHTDAMDAKRVLVNGLGLGMVVRALCHIDSVEIIDVVDNHPDVIALVGPLVTAYGAEHGKTVNVHLGDAHTPVATFPKGAEWDSAWHDIWQTICADHWDSMKTVKRRHARRAGYQAVWCEGETGRHVRQLRKEEKEAEMWRAVFRGRIANL